MTPTDPAPDGERLLEEAVRFRQSLLNFFWRQGVSLVDGEDLVQETYLRLWNYRDRYRSTAKLSTFLFTIARQVRIDALRRESRRQAREDRWSGERGDVQLPPAFGAREEVRAALAQLSEPLREVVELGVFQDLPYAEIAQILDIPLGTVKSRMFNALRQLKGVLNDG